MSLRQFLYATAISASLAFQPVYSRLEALAGEHSHTREFYDSFKSLDDLQKELDSCEPGKIEAWGYVQKADLLIQDKRYDSALQACEEALAVDNRSVGAYQDLSTAYLKLKQFNKSQDYAKKAFDLAGGEKSAEVQALTNMCLAALNQGDLIGAQKSWVEWHKRSPSDKLLLKCQPKAFPQK